MFQKTDGVYVPKSSQTYAVLKANRKIFEGKLLLQRPKEKDFYDCFLKKLNTYQMPRNGMRNNL